MEKVHRVILGFFIIALVVIASLYALLLNKEKQITLFYGNQCNYCAEVEEFIQNNSINEKLKIVSKEVEDNKENMKILSKLALSCDIKENIKIPFVYNRGECYMGKEEVLSFLNNELNKSLDKN